MKLSSPFAVSVAAVAAVVAADPVTVKLQGRRDQLRKRSSAVDLDLTVWKDQSDLQWWGTISVGSPPQDFNVIFDTGSLDIVLPGSACPTCSEITVFDPEKSTSFSAKPGLGYSGSYDTGADAQPLEIPAVVNGSIVTDTVHIAGVSVANQTFLLCNEYFARLGAHPLGPDIDGIFGLAPPGYSMFGMQFNRSFGTAFWTLVEQGSVPEPVFSFFLNSDTAQGELTLGGIDHSRYEGELVRVPFNKTVIAMVGEWYIDQPAFFVDGAPVRSANGSAFPAGISLLDTGTAFIQTPDFGTAQAMYAAISPAIRPLGTRGLWGAPCATMRSLSPTLTFTLGTGDRLVNVTLPPAAFNLGEHPQYPGMCQGVLLHATDPIDPRAEIWILGGPLLKGYYTVWDGQSLELGVGKLRTARNGTGTAAVAGPTAGGVRTTVGSWLFGLAVIVVLVL